MPGRKRQQMPGRKRQQTGNVANLKEDTIIGKQGGWGGVWVGLSGKPAMNDSTCSQPDLYASLNLTKLYVQGSLLQTPPHDIPHPKNLVVLANDIFLWASIVWSLGLVKTAGSSQSAGVSGCFSTMWRWEIFMGHEEFSGCGFYSSESKGWDWVAESTMNRSRVG